MLECKKTDYIMIFKIFSLLLITISSVLLFTNESFNALDISKETIGIMVIALFIGLFLIKTIIRFVTFGIILSVLTYFGYIGEIPYIDKYINKDNIQKKVKELNIER